MIDFSTLVRPKTPNTYLLAPAGLCKAATPDGGAAAFAAGPDEVFGALSRLLADRPRVTLVQSDPARRQLHVTDKTPLMGFIDDIDLLALPGQSGGTDLAVYSRSRVGRSDLGANRKRVTLWVAALRQALAAA